MLAIFFALLFLLVLTRNIMLVILLLEVIGFFVIYFLAEWSFQVSVSDFFVLALFSILVIEGVIALSGLIGLVSFSGSDYISVSSLLK